MRPNRDDVQQMVGALMGVIAGIERAKRRGEASTLAALQVVAQQGCVRPSDIAAELGVNPSTITRQIQALESAGFVQATIDPADQRSCQIRLTEAGLAEVSRLTEIGLSRFAAFVADWDAEEVRTLSRLLIKLEVSKAAVNQREQARPRGRAWQKRAGSADRSAE